MFNNSASLALFSSLAVAGAIAVIVGVILEGAELFCKWGSRRKFRMWVGEIFSKSRRRAIVACVWYVKPRLLPFESIGFAVLVIGLAVELLGSLTAERI